MSSEQTLPKYIVLYCGGYSDDELEEELELLEELLELLLELLLDDELELLLLELLEEELLLEELLLSQQSNGTNPGSGPISGASHSV